MVCTANDLQEWKDFPKGLRVLLLDQDSDSASEITSKLQAMDYTVSIFCNETEAVSAFSSKPESFHLAIVEVNKNNEDGTFKFLETAKELPIIMTSNTQCLSIMMKCIALGAVEFLRKPLSEDKLKNIWQHVVHKAFNAGNLPAKEIGPALHLKLEKEESDDKVSMETMNSSEAAENKYPAPSTPQLSQAARLLDDGDCQDQTICSAEQDCESKSVEITCGDSVAAEVTLHSDPPEIPKDSSVQPHDSESNPPERTIERAETPRVGSGGASNSGVSKSSRKKMKVDWTTELHKKFVRAVEQLGVDQAIPSRILELMNVEGLTRHNVASHLQKYRMHKRHILPKEDEKRWARPREPLQRSCYPQHPPPPHVMAFPTYHSTHAVPVGPVYPPMWGPHAYHPPPWQPAETWHWNPYPGLPPQIHADAWGCPVMPHPQPPHGAYATYPQNTSGFHRDNVYDATKNLCDLQPADEVIDKVVKEAINKPWLPLPLGLKPPSTDSVLSELSRQGISTIPPHITPS